MSVCNPMPLQDLLYEREPYLINVPFLVASGIQSPDSKDLRFHVRRESGSGKPGTNALS